MHGRCHTAFEPESRRTSVEDLAVAERAPDERLTDADREQATDLLTAAFRDGVIGVEEFDQRLTTVLGAQVEADLAVVTEDLPRQWVADRTAAEEARRRTERRRRGWSGEIRTYATVMALLVAIWFVTNLDDFGGADSTYFWPIWPMLGWGIPLFLSRPRGPVTRHAGRLPTSRGF